MNIFISGGCKNGKSHFAQRLAKDMASQRPLYYIATMDPHDSEDEARIQKHIADRAGWGFTTIEQPRDLCACLPKVDPVGSFLLDSVTAIMANEMFPPDGTNPDVDGRRTAEALCAFAEATGHTVFVSDFIYAEGGSYTESTLTYMRALARADRMLAAQCDAVYEVTYGIVTRHK